MNKPLTLASLVCALASSPQLASTHQANVAEGKLVKCQVSQPNETLPENFERLLKSSAEQVRSGKLAMAELVQPTSASF